MTIMTSTTIRILCEAGLMTATVPMSLFRIRDLSSCHRININGTELLITLPTPRAATSCAYPKGAASL